ESPTDNPNEVLAGAFDVQVIGAAPGDRVTVTFPYTAPPGATPRLQYYDVGVNGYDDVTSDEMTVDPAAGTVTVTFSATSVPADELSLTVRPSQDQVLAPGDPAGAPGTAPPSSETVLLGPYLPETPTAGAAGPGYVGDGTRPRLRLFRDQAVRQPIEPAPAA